MVQNLIIINHIPDHNVVLNELNKWIDIIFLQRQTVEFLEFIKYKNSGYQANMFGTLSHHSKLQPTGYQHQ